MNPARELKKVALEIEEAMTKEAEVNVEQTDSWTVEISGLPTQITDIAAKALEDDPEVSEQANLETEEELDKIYSEVSGRFDDDLLEAAFADPAYVIDSVRPGTIVKKRHKEE